MILLTKHAREAIGVRSITLNWIEETDNQNRRPRARGDPGARD